MILKIILIICIMSGQALAVTKVKPLKIGADGVPTETSQSTDYVSSKGFAFENSDSFTLDVQSSKIYALSDGVTAPVCQAPTSSTANNLALFNSTTGHLLKELAAGSNLDVLYYNSTTPAWGSLSTAGIAPNTATYVTINSEASLTTERRLAVNATNMTLTDGGAGSAVTLNTIQDISTSSIPTFQRLLINGSTNQNFINASGTVDAATGDETGYTFDVTGNKATSGTVRVIKSNFTKTSSPGTNYLMDLQKGAVSKFRVGEEGNLSITTATDGASLQLSSGTNTKLIAAVAPAYSTVASTEFTPITFDLSATHTFDTGAFATQRAIRILPPTYSMSSIDTLTTGATLSIEGPPAGGTGINLTNSYGLWIPTRNVTSAVQYGIGAVIAAPTGAFGSNIGLVVDGKFGMGTYTPASFFDIQPTAFDTTMNHVGLDGATRYSAGYFGGTQYSTVPASGAGLMIYDHGVNYGANTSFAQRTFQSLFTLDGGFNYTGAVTNFNTTTTIRTSAGLASTVTSNNATITTSSVAAITNARNYQSTSTYAGSGTVATAVSYDSSNTTVSGSTVTDLIGFRFGLPTVSSGTLTTVTGVDLLDQTETATTKIGFRQRGTNAHNRFNGDTSFSQDSLPGAAIDVAGKLFITSAGLLTKFNNIVTAGLGIPAIYSAPAISATKTANFTVLTYTPPATAGVYQVSGVITTTSSTNTGTVQFTLDYKDSQATTHTADIIPLVDSAGVSATTKTGASKEFHAIPWDITINNAATAIVLKVVITGTVSYTVTGTVKQIQ